MAISWKTLVTKYKGLWVGLQEDEKTVVASGKTVKAVLRKSTAKGYTNPILFRVPTKVVPYVGLQ